MALARILALVALGLALGSMGVGVRIANELRARNIRANPAFTRWMIFRYMAVYRRVTLEETGQVGPLYNVCATISGLAAVFAVAAIIVLLSR